MTRELLSLRHSKITPHLKGAYSAGADILGDKAVVARWTLANSSLLTIAINLGKEAAKFTDPETVFYETVLNRHPGHLPAGSLVAGLDRPL